MKKILLYSTALFILSLAACKKNNLPDERPDDRINAQLAAYQTQLTGATDGWIGYLFPKGGGSYIFTFNFTDKNRVTTQADINATTISTPFESSYRLKAAMLPSLYFDTYSYLHILSDPDPAKSGGSAGVGLYSDFEFSFISSSTDTIKLKGNFNNSDLVLVRKKPADGADFIQKAAAANNTLFQMENFVYFYNLLKINDKSYDLNINPEMKTVNFYYSDGGKFKIFTTQYAVSTNGLVLQTPFVDGSTIISEMHNFAISIPQSTITFTYGNNTVSTTNVGTPLATSLDAAAKMYTSGQYASVTGFIVGGFVDSYKVTTLPGFAYVYFAPNYYSNPADAMLIVYQNGARVYGPAFNVALPANGALIFANPNNFGLGGTSPGTPYTTYVASFRTQLLNAAGYWVFPTSANSYDIVSTADGKIWMRF